jgi:hypothetical protein
MLIRPFAQLHVGYMHALASIDATTADGAHVNSSTSAKAFGASAGAGVELSLVGASIGLHLEYSHFVEETDPMTNRERGVARWVSVGVSGTLVF